MTQIDIKALASLARLEVSEAERKQLENELPGILQFVDTIQKANASVVPTTPVLRNVLRPDDGAHESGIYTEALLSAAPAREGNRIVVKQVISRKKN